MRRTQELVHREIDKVMPQINRYRRDVQGKKAGIYVGGAFKAFSLVRALRLLDMKTVLVGSQTGSREDYEQLREFCDEGTIIVDDSNPLELAGFLQEKEVDLFIGGVKERPIAYKLGMGFCDHNHERKEALAGFAGMVNFAREVHSTVMSPVWQSRHAAEGSGSMSANTIADVNAVTSAAADMNAGLNIIPKPSAPPTYVSTRNPCKACAPLGASAGDARHRRRAAISAWFAGLRDVHAALPDQPFPRADGHCDFGLQRGDHDFGGGENLKQGLGRT